MSSDQLVQIEHMANGGVNAQDVAAVGALLASNGLDRVQVTGLISQIQKLGVQVALGALPELLENIRRAQESRLWGAINRIQALPSMGGYVSKNQVIQILTSVAQQSPRQ
jgi:hypothetical protein